MSKEDIERGVLLRHILRFTLGRLERGSGVSTETATTYWFNPNWSNLMNGIKRLNVNKFTSEEDNDAFIEELKQMWLEWKNPSIANKISVDINKDRNDPTRMTAFVSATGDTPDTRIMMECGII
ncbi:hypothetical protein N9P43_03620 [Planktomarina temperata]|nr:hypothetical protein [Planktomarina temperata]